MSELLVIGLGNPLKGDDGFGAAVLAKLRERELPPGVSLLDGGTGGLSLLYIWENASRVILVDAADMGRTTGEICRLTAADLEKIKGDRSALSLHHTGLAQVLEIGRELAMLPDRMELFAVQAGSTIPGSGLSESVAEAVGKVADLILESIVGEEKPLRFDPIPK